MTVDLAERAEFLSHDPEIRRRILSSPPSQAHRIRENARSVQHDLGALNAVLQSAYCGPFLERPVQKREPDVDAAAVIDLCLRMGDETARDLYARDLISLEAFEAIMDVRLCGIT